MITYSGSRPHRMICTYQHTLSYIQCAARALSSWQLSVRNHMHNAIALTFASTVFEINKRPTNLSRNKKSQAYEIRSDPIIGSILFAVWTMHHVWEMRENVLGLYIKCVKLHLRSHTCVDKWIFCKQTKNFEACSILSTTTIRVSALLGIPVLRRYREMLSFGDHVFFSCSVQGELAFLVCVWI